MKRYELAGLTPKPDLGREHERAQVQAHLVVSWHPRPVLVDQRLDGARGTAPRGAQAWPGERADRWNRRAFISGRNVAIDPSVRR